MNTHVTVTPVAGGSADGPALVFDEPVSLWGGVDPTTATVVDRLHPQRGVSLTGAVVFMPSGRGSSSASSILVEMVRLGTAPAAFVLRSPDEMLTIGSLVADELYGRVVPIVVLDDIGEADGFEVRTGDSIRIDGATLHVERR
ncbi:MAG: DUF126 domain-containing protein [Acidimicrobiia bacterium]|nr:DUF126 domain-containing protein [Acidimicrobiia bacterium]